MSRKFNLKELVNQAKNRTRKLSHEEWDLISENWRSLGEGFLVRFLPYLRWDLIINDMKTEKRNEMIENASVNLHDGVINKAIEKYNDAKSEAADSSTSNTVS